MLARMLPCDVGVLSAVWPQIGGDVVLQTLAFWMKEPTPILKMAELSVALASKPEYGPDDLWAMVLKPLIAAMDQVSVKHEHDNLNRQGLRHSHTWGGGRSGYGCFRFVFGMLSGCSWMFSACILDVLVWDVFEMCVYRMSS